MSTTLKVKYANEIMENMVKNLSEATFNEILKVASDKNEQYCEECECGRKSDEPSFTKDLELADDEEDYCPECEGLEGEESNCMEGLGVAADFTLDKLLKIATALDNNGYEKLADIIDEAMLKISKKKMEHKDLKGKEEKPPKGAFHKAPKEWVDKMKQDVKKKNPDYSMKKVNEIVGDIWDNQLTDKKRQNIYKKYGKTKSPNKPVKKNL